TPLRRALNIGDLTLRTRNSVHVFTNLSRPDRFSAVLNKRASDVQEGRIAKTCISFAIGKSPAPYVEKKDAVNA
ncbi:MAG: hypothetical protein SPF14_05210, partial [Eubacteriales bacterium]|nr:hypothetical protein [Eubacteriales bacterium]